MDRGYSRSRKTADCGVAKRVREMKYGYARVSTTKRDENGAFIQSTALQVDALIDAGVARENIYEDRASGVSKKRPGLDAMLDAVQSGDEVLIWKLDRLGRSARDLLDIAERLKEGGVTIRSLQDGIDTAGSLGGFILTILSAVAELERENIRERVTAGIAASRAAGGRIGRKKLCLLALGRKPLVPLPVVNPLPLLLGDTKSIGRRFTGQSKKSFRLD